MGEHIQEPDRPHISSDQVVMAVAIANLRCHCAVSVSGLQGPRRMHRGRLFHSIQDRFRRKRFRAFQILLDEALEHTSRVSILDVGGSPVYWNVLPDLYSDKVEITCVNFASEFVKYDGLRAGIRCHNQIGDGCDLSQFSDDQFDIVHSNSVIEHVGSFQNMRRFSNEIARVGKAYFVQTPNFWFPIEPHYAFPLVHWLPDVARLKLITSLSFGYSGKCGFDHALIRIDHTRMLSTSMMRSLFADGTLSFERFLLLKKSITASRSRNKM